MSPLSYCKLCELEDFADPELRELMREMHGHPDPADPYPEGAEHRKDWEVAMTARALRDLGAIGPEAESGGGEAEADGSVPSQIEQAA